MARRHIEVLRDLLPGRCAAWAPSERHRAEVEALGVPFRGGDLRAALDGFAASHVVIAAPADRLVEATLQAIAAGVPRLLVEKPGALDLRSGRSVVEAAASSGARLWVGYNRRFYGSLRAALERLRGTGEAIRSVVVEFTEWSDKIQALDIPASAKRRWVLANSMHPIDMGLLPVGLPDPERSAFHRGGALPWHPSAGVMVGSGITVNGVPFALHADWGAPGRWGVEWRTASERLVFRPLEELRVTTRDAPERVVPARDDLDERYKPGLFLQAVEFLSAEPSERLASYEHALRLVELAAAIGGYDAEG
jgi:predicted dehydrogenase